MDTDLILVAGLAVLMLSVPSAVSAFAERRAGWTALVVTVIGAGIFGYGWVNAPPPMTLAEVPHAIIRVLARVIP
ncbi:hypothetical protein [Pseudooceanicola nitratireducens]|jgi:hypothetical protein|uniref:hypothetical protein n=1 Tax=Pseudooceanicola nitratireducens TaxID=517719 RepID=UPI001C980539|nr:hypothetical protein [Pseudooceanicola nitratireducens]MBY6157753.1 hypothetical protein [Pseudooceanicola nitratireducens]MBY6164547.1 hypothetical protein [Pseudooceanicola nitratireducens]MEC7793383.1 hypothetical protein [Pseudomonadota bacterium]